MTPIKNYYLMSNRQIIYKPFPKVYLTRWKFLTRPINFLLRKLHAKEEVTVSSMERVEVRVDKLIDTVQRVRYHQRYHHKDSKTLILGYPQYQEVLQSMTTLNSPFTINEPVLFGCRVILDPFIDGFVLV